MSRGGIRLTAGRLGGRRLGVPRGVRPTEGRVREALFDIIGPRLEGARFLDLFAGSGAVGLEALSRGASACWQVDAATPVVRALADVHRGWKLEGVRAVQLRLPAGLSRLVDLAGRPFDWLFADPPYDFDRYPELLTGSAALAAVGGRLAVEHDRRRELPIEAEGWRWEEVRTYGDSALTFYSAALVAASSTR